MTNDARDEPVEAAPEAPDEPAARPTAPPKPKQRCRLRWFLFGWTLLAAVLLAAGHWWPLRYTGRVIFKHEASPTGKQMAGGRDRDFETYKKELAQRLAGPEAMDSVVVEELKLTKGLPRDKDGELTVRGRAEKHKLIQSLTNALRVQIQTETEQLQRVSVSMEYHDPNTARALPLALVQNYIRGLFEGMLRELEESKQYFSTRVNQADRDHKDALDEKMTFEVRVGRYLPDSPRMLSNKLTSLEREVVSAERDCAETRGKVAMLAVTVYGASATTMPATTMPAATMPPIATPPSAVPEGRLSNEELRERWIAQQYQQIELAAMRTRLDAQERSLRNKREELKQWRAVQARFRPTREEYQRLSRNVSDCKKKLDDEKAKLNRAEDKLSAEVARKARRLEVVWTDPIPVLPSAPHASTVIGLAVILGVWGGLLAAIRPPRIGRGGKVILATATLLLIAGAVFLGWSNGLRLGNPARFAALWDWLPAV